MSPWHVHRDRGAVVCEGDGHPTTCLFIAVASSTMLSARGERVEGTNEHVDRARHNAQRIAMLPELVTMLRASADLMTAHGFLTGVEAYELLERFDAIGGDDAASVVG